MAIAELSVPASSQRGATSEARTSTPSNKNLSDLPSLEMRCEWLDTLEQLQAWKSAWKRLVECAVSPNVFYEPEMLIPAWEHLRQGKVRIAAVIAQPRANAKGQPVLCGMFPLQLKGGLGPWKYAKFWQHPLCFLSTPLMRSDSSTETLRCLLAFLQRERVLAVQSQQMAADGAFQQHLTEFLHTDKVGFVINSLHRRAVFVPANNAETFLSAWPGRKRHELMRLERRLNEIGPLQLDVFDPKKDDLEAWCEDFLRFESLGWKGQSKTAMIADRQQSTCFREMARGLAAENRLAGMVLKHNGNPIAMKVNLLTSDGGYGFKIAYDPAYSKYSPGMLMEKFDAERMHRSNDLQWVDSCAIPDHPMINSLWPQRRLIQSIVLSPGGSFSRLLVAMIPLLKSAKKVLTHSLSRCRAMMHRLRSRHVPSPSESQS